MRLNYIRVTVPLLLFAAYGLVSMHAALAALAAFAMGIGCVRRT